MTTRDYNEKEWELKLSLMGQKLYDRISRSRWDFAKENIPNGAYVLDVACGDGVLGKILMTEKKCRVVGIDVARNALNLARENGLTAEYCDISEDKFPFADNTFDYVTALCCIEHVINPVHCVSEAIRVLKSKGNLIVTLPNAVNYRIREDFNKGIVSPELLHAKPGEGMHVQFYNYDNEFENKVLSKISGITVTFKKGDLKDKTKYTQKEAIRLLKLIKRNPNKYSEYVHWIIEKT